jgi:glutaminyl-peptide cyclotransferase
VTPSAVLSVLRRAPHVALASLLVACGTAPEAPTPAPIAAGTAATTATAPESRKPTVERWIPRVRAVWPHDAGAFTQGLVWRGGRLFESTGLYGRSSVRRVVLETGEVERETPLPERQFGEGLAFGLEEWVQITWQEGVAHRFGSDDLAARGAFRYSGEGWGLAFDGTAYWMSDGSATLRRRDPRTFAVLAERVVTLDGQPVERLNELEYVAGQIYANVWMTDRIVRIDPETGHVTATIDASSLLSPEERSHADVLNGIAYDGERQSFFLTGKLWPKLFEVDFVADDRP